MDPNDYKNCENHPNERATHRISNKSGAHWLCHECAQEKWKELHG